MIPTLEAVDDPVELVCPDKVWREEHVLHSGEDDLAAQLETDLAAEVALVDPDAT